MSAEEFKNKWKDVISYIEDRSDNFSKDLDSLLKEAAQQTKELSEENERLKESLNKIDNLIGNYMHNDSVKIGTLVLDIQEIAVKT